MKHAARFLTAMAIVSLAIVYVATRDNLPQASAATGTINALNVGTCYASDADAFTAGDCDDGDGSFEIAGTNKVTKADNVYATYAVDPKTSAENPRAIIFNGDLLKISIKDQGRDKRTGVIYAVNGGTAADADNRQGLLRGSDYETYQEVIVRAVGDQAAPDIMAGYDHDNDADTADVPRILLAADGAAGNDATFRVSTEGIIERGGQTRFLLSGDLQRQYPMAPIDEDFAKGQKTGRIKLFGFLQSDDPGDVQIPASASDFADITNFFTLDEDEGCIPDPDLEDPDLKCRASLPWFYAAPDVPDGQVITVMYVYYETSEREEIHGGKKKIDYEGYDGGTPDDTEDDRATTTSAIAPVFVDEENAANSNENDQKALSASVSADGEKETRHLYLRETGWFTGVYVGYVRLTDSNGNGSEAGDNTLGAMNWGRKVRNATDSTVDGATVLGVESGPVTIKYRDTDGEDQSLSISIDTSAPTVSIDAPAHEFATRDASPNLTGTFSDAGSGLRKDSFKLYADNKDDGDEDGNNAENLVFDLKVYIDPDADKDEGRLDTRGYVNEPDDQIEIAGNYTGYRTGTTTVKTDPMSSPFGVVKASEVYHPETGEGSTYTVDDIAYDLRQIVDAEDYDDGAPSGEFDDNVRFTFSETLPNETFNNTIDFQAVVMDVAGNLGFSDSDANSPRFIHEYGIRKADRKKDKHNVLGWYSRHILFLDLVDPAVQEDESATGFFGVDDGDNVRNDNGVMVVFDKPVSADTVNTSTFEVTLDDGTEATVVDTTVNGKKVFLQLEEQLDPDAKPKVDLAPGEVIRDLAGNSTLPREFDEITLSDGILPTFTVELSNGSGLLEPDYGPDKITKERITISIRSNEAIQGAPKFAVLCANFRWFDSKPGVTDMMELPDADEIAEQREQNNIAKYVSNRTGSMTTGNFAKAEPVPANIGTNEDEARGLPAQDNCAYETPEGTTDNPNPNNVSTTTALQRGENRWEYQWNNIDDLLDGKLTVVVTGRDRGGFDNGDDAWVNYGTATAEFTLDTSLKKPTLSDGTGGEVIPAEDEAVSEPRPFVLVDFSEKTPVDVTMFEVDGESVIDAIEELDNNRFVYWPEPLDIGTYTVKVEANDAANNTTEFQYKFTVRDRLPFSLNLLAGWNAISFPANPQDRALHAVFTAPEIDQVIGWDATNPTSPWRAATRVDGVWTTGEDYAVLNDIEARYGYWVHSSGFVTQSVKLVGKGARIGPLFDNAIHIPTNAGGWNFVGVVDIDGDQTEDNAGQTLLNSKKAPITASQYLGDYRNAYTWNNIDNKWQRMRGDGPVTIGTGIWVYYTKGSDVAP